MQPIIYLNFDGNCFEAMSHYADVLGGEITSVFRNGDSPDTESRMPGGDDLVMNMNMVVGNTMIMASDTPGNWYTKPQGFSVSLAPQTEAEFERVYTALSKDARSEMMAPAETFWAQKFAMFTDRFGTPWMLNFEGNKRMS